MIVKEMKFNYLEDDAFVKYRNFHIINKKIKNLANKKINNKFFTYRSFNKTNSPTNHKTEEEKDVYNIEDKNQVKVI